MITSAVVTTQTSGLLKTLHQSRQSASVRPQKESIITVTHIYFELIARISAYDLPYSSPCVFFVSRRFISALLGHVTCSGLSKDEQL